MHESSLFISDNGDLYTEDLFYQDVECIKMSSVLIPKRYKRLPRKLKKKLSHSSNDVFIAEPLCEHLKPEDVYLLLRK